MKYAVVIEKGPNSFGAYVPDLPGCIAVGETRTEALQLIQEAIELHLQGLQEQASVFLHLHQQLKLSALPHSKALKYVLPASWLHRTWQAAPLN